MSQSTPSSETSMIHQPPKLSHKLRSLVFYVWLSASTIIWIIPSLIIAPLLSLKHRNYFVMTCYCSIVIFGLRWICGIRCVVEGRENIPNDGRGHVILSKHQSTWETFMLPLLIAPHVQVVKKELAYLPFFGWGLQLIRPIFIDRSKKSNALKQVIQQGGERLDDGIHVLVFPEGSRIAAGKRKAFSKGGVMLATKTKAPAVMVAHNSGEHWPNTSWVKRPGTIRMVISPVLETADMTTAQLTETVENWVNEQVDRISETPFSGEYVEADTSGKRF